MPTAASSTAKKPAADDAAAGRASIPMYVPHYNVNGNQHHRVPFQDLSHVKDTKKLSQFEKEPHYRTRTEMLEARQVSNMPHISYDCDGDGVVVAAARSPRAAAARWRGRGPRRWRCARRSTMRSRRCRRRTTTSAPSRSPRRGKAASTDYNRP